MIIKYSDIFVNRHGSCDKSYMITNKLLNTFEPNSEVLFKNHILSKSTTSNHIIQTIWNAEMSERIEEFPPNIIIKGKIMDYIDSANNNNILGKNQIMTLDTTDTIIIPIAETTIENLAFYNCKLIIDDMTFKLDNSMELPLFDMSIGENYVNNYLLQEHLGGGFYIEKHNTPHYHQPTNKDSCGYLILGKSTDTNTHDIILSKFKIPYGKAIYTSPDTFHNDAYLIGDYNVIYTKTEDYQTYLLKTPDDKIIIIE